MNDHAPVVTPHRHHVVFYDHDADLFEQVAGFAADGAVHGERLVCISTEAHRDALTAAHCVDPTGAAPATDSVPGLVFDATETLSRFLVAGAPDHARFMTAIGSVLDKASDDGRLVRVFGEMVALLWQGGLAKAAVQVEALWNELAATRQFSLLCAYPAAVVEGAALTDVTRVCELHTKVVPPRSYLSHSPAARDAANRPATASRAPTSATFLPLPVAVSAARRFVAETLTAWQQRDWLADALLVTSELATNAIVEAGTAFRVHLEPQEAVLQITVEDLDPNPPALGHIDDGDIGGRGLAILNQRAQRWGWDQQPEGKAVWAELGRR